MRNNSMPAHPASSAPRRAGVTLSEVLISVALLSLGIIGLALLFPLSVLKSIQATQLTHGTNLRYNAEAYLDTIVPSPLNTAPADAALTLPTVSTDPVLVYAVDPVGFLRYYDAAGAAGTNPGHFVGNDGTGVKTGNTRRIPGLAVVDSDTPTTGEQEFLKQLGTLPDSWLNFIEGQGNLTSQTEFTFASTVNISDLDTVSTTEPAYKRPRIVLFHADGNQSLTRPLDSVTGQVVTWTDDVPASYPVARARIETYDPRYTWMMTVRKSVIQEASVGPPAVPIIYSNRIDVVIFFNRRYSPQDERVYSAPGGGRTAFVVFKNTVELDYSATGTLPFIKKGGYIFDSTNGYWYRIIRYTDDQTNQKVTIYLDRNALANSDSAILMRGIVDVFPIATRES